MLDKDGKLPRIKGALMADAVATTVGAVLGTSTTTTFVESASGVTEGGRTGLTTDNSDPVWNFPFLITNLSCNSVLCDSSGTDHRRLLYAEQCGRN